MGAPEQAEKRREHFAFAKAPDWKYTPLKPNRGVPVPYWTIAYFDKAQKTAPSAEGRGNDYFVARSRAPVSNGGEAGKGKGVLTGAYMDEFEPKQWSDTLIIEGDGAVFQGHMGTINKGNAPAKVYTSMNPDQAIADKACWEKLKTNLAVLGVTSKDRMFDDTTGCLKDVLSGAWGTISGDVAAVGDMLGSVWGGIKSFFSDPWAAVDGMKQFGAQAYEAGKQVVEVIQGLRDGSITMDDLLDFAADMLQDQLCEVADKIEEMVKQGKGCEAVGVLLGQATEAAAVAAATALTGGAAGGAAVAAGGTSKFAKAAEMLGEAGVKAGDSLKAAIQKLKDLKRRRKEAPRRVDEPHLPKEPRTTDSSTPGYTNPLPCPVCPQVGNPVNPVQGCKVLAGEPDLDFDLPGPFPLRWQRTYVSSNARAGWLGQGWTLPFSIAIELRRTPQGARLIVIDEFGREIMFPALRVGTSHYNEFEQITLTATEAQQLELVSADRTRRMAFRQLSGAARGRQRYVLEEVSDRNGNAIRISYGEHGLPASVADCAGRTLALHFEDLGPPDSSGARRPMLRLKEVEQLAAGAARGGGRMLVRYDYSAQGDLVRVTNALGHAVREFQYRHHMMVRQGHAEGMWSSYDYDVEAPHGRVLRSHNAIGERHEFEYGQSQTRVTDQLGRTEVYEFNDRKEWTGTIDALGGRTVRELDAFGKLIAVTDPAGRTTRYGYDDKGRITRLEEPGATALSPQVTSATYEEGSGHPASITDPTGATARFRYDERGNLLEMIDPLGHTTSYSYDARGLPVEVIDAQGKTRRLAYNAVGQLVRLTDCSGQSTHYSYASQGHLACIADALGQVVRYRHDALGRLLSVQQPDGATEIYAYDKAGRLIAHTDAMGARTEYTLAPDGLPLLRRNALGAEMRYAYDAGRRLSALHNENGARCDFRYDVLDRLMEETGFDGRHTRYRYDPAGLLLGKLELGCLSASQRLAQRLAHDPAVQGGALPPQRTVPTYEDPWGLGLADEIAPAGRLPGHAIVTTFQRDTAGRVLEKQVAGRVLDTAGQAQPQTRRTRYRYDEAGRLIEASNDAGSRIALAYDALGKLTREGHLGHGLDGALAHRYDALGNRTGTLLPDGSNLAWLYYGSGHLHQINLDGRVICDIERDALHRETGRSQGALQSAYRYDPAGRLAAHRAWMREASARPDPGAGPNTSAAPDDFSPQGAMVLSRHYQYDAGGHLLEIADRRRGSSRFSYDRIGRLLSAEQRGSSERFAFDPAHNLQSASQATAGDPGGQVRDNRIEVFEDKRYRYDSHGNLIEKRIGRHTVIRLAWDVEHQLSGALVTRNGAAQQTRYAYDAFGRRILKEDRFGRTLFIWDGNQLLSEQRGDQRCVYVYEPGGTVPLAMLRAQEVQRAAALQPTSPATAAANDAAADDEWRPRKANTALVDRMLMAQKALREQVHGRFRTIEAANEVTGAAGQDAPAAGTCLRWRIHHYQNDHLGTPRELTDEDGAVLWSAGYKAWGNTLRVEAVQPARGSRPEAQRDTQQAIEQNLRFQGHYFDTETGLHYNRFRYYDPDVGRFVSQDPIGLEGAQNLYMYAPNPTGWIDPFGLACLKWNAGARRWQNPAGRFVRLPTRDFLDKAMQLQGLKSPPASLKQSWQDGGYKYEVRAHPANPAHGSTGSIYRVSRQMPGQGTEYMDIHGCWHHESTLKEFFKGGANNPNFNSSAAADTHIPF